MKLKGVLMTGENNVVSKINDCFLFNKVKDNSCFFYYIHFFFESIDNEMFVVQTSHT